MKIARMNPYDGESKTAAFFDLETEEGITVKGFKLIKGQHGLFVSAPQSKGKDDKYYDKVVIPEDMKKKLQEMALKKYEEETDII